MCRLREKDEFVSSEQIADHRIRNIEVSETMMELVVYLTRLMGRRRQTGVQGSSNSRVPRYNSVPMGFRTGTLTVVSYPDDDLIILSTPGPIIDID